MDRSVLEELAHDVGQRRVGEPDGEGLGHVEDGDRLASAGCRRDQGREPDPPLEPGGAQVPPDDVVDLEVVAPSGEAARARHDVPLGEGVAEGAGPVGSEGEIVSWSWVGAVRDGQILDHPHALALVRLDGADTAMLHVVDAPSADAVRTGARVRIRWAEERSGSITDIAAFELIGADA